MLSKGSYEAQLSTDVNKADEWENAGAFTAARTTFDELTPGKTYWARLRAIGSAGPGAWSERVPAMAL